MDYNEIIDKLTCVEKAQLTNGATYWETCEIENKSIQSIRMSDGPHGLRRQEGKDGTNVNLYASRNSTCFPPASLSSCSFNRELFYSLGEAIANECLVNGVDLLLGPAINIKRSPLGGRNFEYASEDPYVSAEFGKAYVNGAQDKGIGVCLKHLACNNQENFRLNVNSVVDERTYREIYLYAFERIVKECKPYTIMASYNPINEVYACENKELLTNILREEWGFDGFIISDWGAVYNKIAALDAGLNLEMPSTGNYRIWELKKALENKELDQSVINQRIKEILKIVEKCKKTPKTDEGISKELETKNHELAVKIAEESMVLLKNEEKLLPLSKTNGYAVIGEFAEVPKIQGGGSSHINPTCEKSFLDVLKQHGISFEYEKAYSQDFKKLSKQSLNNALSLAKKHEKVIVFLGLPRIDDSEGVDRKTLDLPLQQRQLLCELYNVNPNICVVLCAGGAVATDWDINAKSILYSGVSGQGGAEAMFKLLFGDVSPSGKFTETFPARLEDTPTFNNFGNTNNSVYYAESIYVGYRYYTTALVPVKYPFGFGLSYSNFAYSDFKLSSLTLDKKQSLKVTVKVKNIGSVPAYEVVQIYMKNRCQDAYYAVIELKGFEKVFLQPNEEKIVEILLDYDTFRHYDTLKRKFVVTTGEYEICVCKDSFTVLDSCSIKVQGDIPTYSILVSSPYASIQDNSFSEADFEKICMRKLPPKNIKFKKITLNTPFRYCKKKLLGRIFYSIVKGKIKKMNLNSSKESRAYLIEMLRQMPIRMLVTAQGEGLNLWSGEALVDILNGKIFKGIKKLKDTLKPDYLPNE